MRWLFVSIVAAAAACGSSKQGGEDKPAPGSAKPSAAVPDAPMPLALGECDLLEPTTWVSGPRPLPLTLGADDDPPPPPEEDKPDDGKDESGGTGQAMALDEGKMGRKVGEYHMKKDAHDDAVARQQAIDEAREAGILGEAMPKREPTVYGGLTGTRANLARETNAPAFGTIGDGSTGRDVPVGSRVGGPTVTVGANAAATADTDKDMIRRYMHRNVTKVTYCYEKQLLVKPKLAGTVTAKFFITPSGKVTNASASGLDPDVASCIAKFIGEIKFAKPKGGGGIQVSYPFKLRPAGDDSAPSTGSNSPPAAGSDSAAATPPKPSAPPQLFRSSAPDATMYRPGERNRLQEHKAELTSCVRGNPTPYGAVVVELGPAPRVYGLDDAKTQACVLDVAKKMHETVQLRCSFAFGVMPPSAQPGIDVAGDAVMFAGKTLALGPGSGPAPSVVDAVRTTLTGSLGATAPVVSIHGPLAIRATDATTVGVLTRVVAGVLAAGDDFVLATRRGNEWQLVDKLDLPVVPVPVGSGGRWNRVMGSYPDGMPRLDDSAHVSVLITKDTIWVGVSRVEDFTSIARDAAQWTKLAAALKEKKASSFFVDHTDIEIAADDDVTYGDLVKVIDSAKQAGFVDWMLTDPPGLSARPKH